MRKGFAPIIILILVALAVVGYFGYKNYWPGPQTLVVASPTPTATSDVTANWKTYINTEFGFQIKYPDNWSIKEDKTLQSLALITVTIAGPSQNTLLDIWVRNGTWSQTESELKAKSTKTAINGIEGLVEPAGDGKVYTFPSNKNNQIVQIVYGPSSGSPSDEIKTLDQILSTFKFIN